MEQQVMDREGRGNLRMPRENKEGIEESILSETQKYPGYGYNRAPHTTHVVQTRTPSWEILIQAYRISSGHLAIKNLKKLLSRSQQAQ